MKPEKVVKVAKVVKKKPNRKYAEPFRQQNTLIHLAFNACKKGIRESDLIKLILKHHGKPMRIITVIKKCTDATYQFQWDVHETDGFLKVTNIRPAPKID